MLFVGSLVKVIDNTGVLKARCIKIVKGSSSIEAFVGDLIVVVVTEVDISKKNIRRGDYYKGYISLALVTSTWIKKQIDDTDDHSIWFVENSVILINRFTQKPLSTRVGKLLPFVKSIKAFIRKVGLTLGLIKK